MNYIDAQIAKYSEICLVKQKRTQEYRSCNKKGIKLTYKSEFYIVVYLLYILYSILYVECII